jgi:hypothetical protein
MEENPSDYVVIASLLPALGVQWTPVEQERRLFVLCVQVQATLRGRHGRRYETPDVSLVPVAYVDEAKELMRAEFSASGLWH